jgi:threonine/homoserine/homoserine lactone efflux protein
VLHPVAVAGFLVAVLPLIATPGASLTLLVQHVTAGGRRRAVPVVLGTITGLYVHATLALLGLSALVMQSSQTFAAVRLAGAAYLVGLSLWTWRSARAEDSGRQARMLGRRRLPLAPDSAYAQAVVANVLNPKAASIYLTLVPQFLTPHQPVAGQILVLATAHALLIAGWLLVWTVLLSRASGALQRPRIKQLAMRITAAVLLALGVRAAGTVGAT